MFRLLSVPRGTAETLLGPLDALRRAWLRALGPWSRPLITQPELRVSVGFVVAVATALAGTLLFPLWLLAVSPILLGVPHLISDVRYLVVRPGLHRRMAYALLVGGPLLCAGLGAGMPAGLAAVTAAVLLASGSWRRKLAVLPLLLALGLWGRQDNYQRAEVVLAHVHNFVGVLLLYLWRPRRGALLWAPLLLFLLVAAGLLFGWIAPLATGLRSSPADLDLELHLAALAPSLPEAWGARVVLLFAFAQAVHYAAWLRLIPEQDRERKTPRTFAASLRALRADLGGLLVAAFLLLGLGIAVWAIFDLAAARVGYFRLALFHGYLELSALALIYVAWQPLRRARPEPAAE